MALTLFYITSAVAVFATVHDDHPAQCGPCPAVPHLISIGRWRYFLFVGRAFCRRAGSDYLRRRHHGPVCFRDHDAQSGTKDHGAGTMPGCSREYGSARHYWH